LGYSDAANRRHIDFTRSGTFGYIEVRYQYDGESVATLVIYFRADDKFVPIKSTNDIPRREDWDTPSLERSEMVGRPFAQAHGPCVIEVSAFPSKPN